MNIVPSLRLKPLAIGLAVALALAPAGVLLADPARPLMRPQPPAHIAKRPPVAEMLAMNTGLTKKGLTLKQVMEDAAAKARAAGPRSPERPAGIVAVTSCDDSGAGTLRDAVTNAVSGDVIDLTGLSACTITLSTGAITTSVDDLTIQGPGADVVTVDAAQTSGVFSHYGAGTMTIDGLTIANGRIEGYAYHGGACVLSSGNIALTNSTATNCYSYTAHAYGGALCAVGNITLINAKLSGNTTKGHFYYYYYPGYPNPYRFDGTSRGGGAYAMQRLTITGSTITHNTAMTNNRGSVGGGVASRVGGHHIESSTFDNNYAWLGGGIDILGPFGGDPYGLTVINSTISGNTASQSGGGLNTFYLAYVTLHNSTVTGNYAPYCGGTYIYYGNADIKSSIIAGNTSTYIYNQFGYYTAADLDVFSGNATITGDHNAIMTSNAPTPADTITADPLLLPLADNGGATMTHAFDLTSPVLDAGSNPDALEYDQRGDGFAREAGTAADIGAYEEPAQIPDEIFADGFEPQPTG